MKLKLLSHNVQGLNNPDTITRVRNYLLPLLSQLDIVLLHEHKLRGDKTSTLGKSIWARARFYSTDADPAYGHAPDEPGAGSSGICTWIALAIKHLVQSSGQTRSGRAQWIRLSGIPGGDISILNVYAPNTPNRRRALWDELAATLPQDCRWVLAGDWNVVEHALDKFPRGGSILEGAEKISFCQLMGWLEVTDSFNRNQPIRYTWDNKRHGSNRILARLDRVYSFMAPAGAPTTLDNVILGDSTHYDHLPVRCGIELKSQEKRPSPWKMNASYLDDPHVIAAFTRIWSSNPLLGFFGKTRKCTRFYRQFCKQKAARHREKEALLRRGLSQVMGDLQASPTDPHIQQRLSECADELERMEIHKLRGQQIRSRVKWMQVGDTGSKEFYRATKQHFGASHITELENLQGVSCHEQTEIEGICLKYYQALYT